MPLRFFWILIISLLAVPLQAQFANPHLDNAKSMEAELNYEEMPDELAAALSQPGNTPEELVEIYRLLGMAHLALRNNDKAKYAFIKLLSLDSSFQMPSSENPRFRKAFGDIKAEFEQNGRILVEHKAPDWSGFDVGEAPADFEVTIQVTDTYEQIAKPRIDLTLKVNGSKGSPIKTTLNKTGRNQHISTFSGKITNPGASFPAGTISYYEIEYVLVMENQTGATIKTTPAFEPVILQVGDPLGAITAPKKLQPRPEPNPQQAVAQEPEIIRAPSAPEIKPPTTTSSTSLIVTGIVVGTILIVGGSLVTYYCVIGDSCSGEPIQPEEPGSLDVIVTPRAAE